jgi:hypothetical protein
MTISNASEKKMCATKPYNPVGFFWHWPFWKVYKLWLTSSMFMHEIFQVKTLVFMVSVYLVFEKINQRNLALSLSWKTIYLWLYKDKNIHCIILGKSATCSDSNRQSPKHCISTPILHSWPPKKNPLHCIIIMKAKTLNGSTYINMKLSTLKPARKWSSG